MDLRQLEYFVTLAEELHFGRAAKRLHVAQPPLSQQIQRLEREFGVPLFFRSSHKVELTSTGALLLPQARSTLEAAARTMRLARSAAAGDVGEVRIGFVSSALYIGLPGVIRAFRRDRPDVRLVLTQAGVSAQLEALRQDQLDVCFMCTLDSPPDLEAHVLGTTELVAVLPDDHPLADQDPVPLMMLRDDVFLRFKMVEHNRMDYITGACTAAGFSPTTSEVATDIQSVIALVGAGMGVSLLPASGRLVQLGGVVFRRIDPHPPAPSYFVVSNESRTQPATREFIDHVRKAEWLI